MKIKITENLDDPRITKFLIENKNSTIYHHPVWVKAISRIYNFQPYYLLITGPQGNELTGLFPFVVNRNKGKGKIISLPSTTHCEPILPNKFDFNIIIQSIKEYFGSDSIEFDFKSRINLSIQNFTSTSDYFVHIIELCPTLEETFNSFGKRSIRRLIRKADENRLSFRLGNSGKDLKIFYELEIKLRKSIGLPPAPYEFFKTLWDHLSKENLALLPVIEFDGNPIAASIVLKFKDTFYFEYTAIDKKYIDLYPNHKLHWEIIKIAQNDYNAKFINMGRTAVEQENLIYFKEKWNAKPFPLYRNNYPPTKKNNLKRSVLFKYIKSINSVLPSKILELEGKILFKYFD